MADAFNAKVAHFVEVTAAALADADAKLGEQAAKDKAYNEKVAAVVDELIGQGFVKQSAREVAIQKLSNPVFALDQIVNLATASKTASTGKEAAATPIAEQLGTQIAATGSQPKVAGRKRGAHYDKFLRSLNLDPETLNN